MYHVELASPDHVPHLAARMRAADRREVMASHGHNPTDALRGSLERSEAAWTLMVHGQPAAMGGVTPAGSILSLTGRPWLLGTEGLYQAPRPWLARQSRLYVDAMRRLFPRLENWCHADNSLSLRWLRWCGFVIESAPRPYGLAGEPFYRFYKE